MKIQEALAQKAPKATTHFQVDLDAIMTVALYAYLIGVTVVQLVVRFVPSNIAELPDDEIGLDISAGLKGIDSSAFEELLSLAPPPTQQALAVFARHVTIQDQGGMFTLPPEVQIGTLGGTIIALKAAGLKDADLLRWGEQILLAQIKSGENRIACEKALEQATWLADGRIAVLPQGSPQGSNAAAFEAGAQFAIYQDGDNVGLVRSSKIKEPHLGKLLGPHLPEGFYLDERGFMVAWGTMKAPAKSPSPLNGIALGELLASKLSS